jgi:hypothetical protein
MGRIKARSEGQLYPAIAEIRTPKAVRRGIIERDIITLTRRFFFCITVVFINDE